MYDSLRSPSRNTLYMQIYAVYNTGRFVCMFQVFYDLNLHFGRRGRENLHEMKVSDFAITHDAEGDMFLFNVCDEQTKNHQTDLQKRTGRMWEVKGIESSFFQKYKYNCVDFFPYGEFFNKYNQ